MRASSKRCRRGNYKEIVKVCNKKSPELSLKANFHLVAVSAFAMSAAEILAASWTVVSWLALWALDIAFWLLKELTVGELDLAILKSDDDDFELVAELDELGGVFDVVPVETGDMA